MTFPLGRISEPRAFLLVFCVHGLCSAFAKFIAFIAKILDPAFVPSEKTIGERVLPFLVSVSLV